jgi:uncharacterized membrane protein YgdD (TMEM256/DUF423 family)
MPEGPADLAFVRAVIVWAGLLGLSAVAGGAFAAHGVSDPHARMLLQTGGQYGLAHALAALAALGVQRVGGRAGAGVASWCFLAGGSIFSGSLYALALSGLAWLGAVTPIGGLLMLAGWALLAWAGLRLRPDV